MYEVDDESALWLPHAPSIARVLGSMRALMVQKAIDGLLVGVTCHPDFLELLLAARRPRR